MLVQFDQLSIFIDIKINEFLRMYQRGKNADALPEEVIAIVRTYIDYNYLEHEQN